MNAESSLRETEAPGAPSWAAEWSAHFLTVVISFIVLWIIGAFCTITITFDDFTLPELLAPYTFGVTYVLPEPAERTTYLAALVTIPVFMLLVQPTVRAHASQPPPARQRRYFIGSLLAMLGLLGWGGLGDGFFYWRGCLAYSHPIVFLLVTTAVGILWLRCPRDASARGHVRRLFAIRDVALAAAVLAFVVLTSILRMFPASDTYVIDNHFEAVFFATTQVTLGATLLVDLPHQYGLYPEFLAPVFRAIGAITVLRFTVVMALVQVFVHALWLAALLRVMRTRWMAMLTFLGAFSLVGFVVSLFVIEQKLIPYYDPYFQYFPVRSLFPAIALYAMAWIAERDRSGKRLWRCLPSAILGTGVLWNTDAGVPALGAWILCLCHLSIVRRKAAAHFLWGSVRAALPVALEALLVAAVAVLLGLAALAWKAGAWPDLDMNLRFQRSFYVIGFNMLPMRIAHSWVAWAAVVMAALSFGIWPLSSREFAAGHAPLRSTLFGWAVLACGLFAYYQGRSHDWVFPVVIPFALAFVAVAIDRLLVPAIGDQSVVKGWRVASGMVAAAFVVAMASGAVGAWEPDGTLVRHVRSRWQGLVRAVTTDLRPEAVVFLQQRLTPGGTALILSNHAGVYHAETRTRSLLPTSLIELVLQSDRDTLLRRVADADTVFVDRSVLDTSTAFTNEETNVLLCLVLAEHFDKVGESSSGYMMEFKHKAASETANGENGR